MEMLVAELIVLGLSPQVFNQLEDAKRVGRELHRSGEDVLINTRGYAGAGATLRYESSSDEWLECFSEKHIRLAAVG